MKAQKRHERPPLITIKDVAKRLNLSQSTVRNKITTNDWDSIPKPKIKIGKSWRWESSDLEAFINGHKIHYKTANKKAVPAQFAEYMD